LDEIRQLEPADLLAGDILLYRPKNLDRASQLIAAVTGSPYTHAAIFFGDNLIAEALTPIGVTKTPFVDSLKGNLCVGVLRTQMGFGAQRRKKLLSFVDAVVLQQRPFHKSALIHFQRDSQEFFDKQLEIMAKNYGKAATTEELAARAYFCSGFVTACYEAVGIIDETAQVAYPPEFFSPAHLYKHNTFGWLLGYVLPNGDDVVPSDDPLRSVTNWNGIPGIKWWH